MRADVPWAQRAACAGTDPEIFFGADTESLTVARETCDRCPVLPECFAASLARSDTHGVWAGFTEYQRRQIRRMLTSDGGALSPERALLWVTTQAGPVFADEPARPRRGRPRRADVAATRPARR